MSDINCEETKRHVHEFLHSELAEAEITEITAHLANCDSCEKHYDVEVILNQVIQRSCSEEAPADLADKVMARIRDIQRSIRH